VGARVLCLGGVGSGKWERWEDARWEYEGVIERELEVGFAEMYKRALVYAVLSMLRVAVE
jgi:hypothetical protein